MDIIKNDSYFVSKLCDDMFFIINHTKDISVDELANDEVLLDSMLFRLIKISENAKRLSDEYKNDHPSVPWTAIYGLRNRIVHDYGNVDIGIVYSTLTEDIPQLVEAISSDDAG